MSEERKPRRPRIDAVLRAIRDGDYDEEIEELAEAVESRQEVRKEAILKLVKKVYGEDYAVARQRNPFIDKAKEPSEPAQAQPQMSEDDPEQSSRGGVREEDMEIESRGAIIGPLPGQFPMQ